jgi:hypothetical protein
MCTLARLFDVTRDIRRSILRQLRPFDIARFLAASGCHLTEDEWNKFMNPIHDVFYDCHEVDILIRAGVKIVLLGHRLKLLYERLRDPTKFLKEYGDNFIIDLVAIAYCRPDQTNPLLQLPSTRFVVTDQLLERLGQDASIAYAWLEHDLRLLPCTNTCLAPYRTPETTNMRVQLFKLNLRCFWFNTIDLVHSEETENIFDWSFDKDIIETSVMIISWNDKGLGLYNTRSSGRWLAQPPAAEFEVRGTPALTRHRPVVNMQEIMVRLEVPKTKSVGIVRIPAPL